MSLVEDQLRETEYKLSQMKYLTEYKLKQRGTDRIYLNTITCDIDKLLGIVDRARSQLQDDSDDEEVVLMLFSEE